MTVWSLRWEDPLEEGMATHSSILGLLLWFGWWRIYLRCGRPGFDSWVGKKPWRRERLPTPIFWPGEFHGLYSPWGHKELDTTEWLSLSAYFHYPFICWKVLCLYSFICLSNHLVLSFVLSGSEESNLFWFCQCCEWVQTEAISLGNPTKRRNVGGMPHSLISTLKERLWTGMFSSRTELYSLRREVDVAYMKLVFLTISM